LVSLAPPCRHRLDHSLTAGSSWQWLGGCPRLPTARLIRPPACGSHRTTKITLYMKVVDNRV